MRRNHLVANSRFAMLLLEKLLKYQKWHFFQMKDVLVLVLGTGDSEKRNSWVTGAIYRVTTRTVDTKAECEEITHTMRGRLGLSDESLRRRFYRPDGEKMEPKRVTHASLQKTPINGADFPLAEKKSASTTAGKLYRWEEISPDRLESTYRRTQGSRVSWFPFTFSDDVNSEKCHQKYLQ